MFTIKQLKLIVVMAIINSSVLPTAAQPKEVSKSVKNIVLVHGAFADGTSWSKVISLLQNQGYNVIAVQNPLLSLEDDVAATKRAIESMNGPVLLVGHSWAGVVITEAGNNPQVSGLLYVCAFAPNDGQSIEDVSKAFPPAAGNSEVQLSKSGFLSLSQKGINEYFAQDLPIGARKVMFATQGPWSAKAPGQKVSKAAWKTKPSWFIVGTNDYMINPELERSAAKMIKAKTIELSSSHVPMMSMPNEVASFIISAAQNVSGE